MARAFASRASSATASRSTAWLRASALKASIPLEAALSSMRVLRSPWGDLLLTGSIFDFCKDTIDGLLTMLTAAWERVPTGTDIVAIGRSMNDSTNRINFVFFIKGGIRSANSYLYQTKNPYIISQICNLTYTTRITLIYYHTLVQMSIPS